MYAYSVYRRLYIPKQHHAQLPTISQLGFPDGTNINFSQEGSLTLLLKSLKYSNNQNDPTV